MHRRLDEILKLLERDKEVHVNDLARRFSVTVMTIRRDLDRLEQMGRVTRTHGGAILARAGIVEFRFLGRERSGLPQKQAIAKAVARSIRPGMTLTLDTGTTTLEVARAIAGIPDLKVLTTSLAIASALYTSVNVDLVLLGGSVRSPNPDLMGPLTEANLRQFRVNVAILGADAANAEGIFTTDIGVAQVSKAMMASAEQVWLTSLSGKFEKSEFALIGNWQGIDRVIVDDGMAASTRRWLEEAVDDVEYVSCG